MAEAEVPSDVRELIADHITSVEQLEILLLLRDHPDEEWTAKAVSDEMRSSARSAEERLFGLETSGLLASRPQSTERVFRFAPVNAFLTHAAEHLAAAYNERRYTVIDLIFSKPIDKLRVYADAFRFRKDGSHG